MTGSLDDTQLRHLEERLRYLRELDERRISILASIDGQQLQVDVLDDGIGFNVHAGDGLGLANVRERLRILYGARACMMARYARDISICRPSVPAPRERICGSVARR